MKKVLVGTVSVLAAAFAALAAQPEWRPVQGPLVTRWAREVSPGNVRPEYPRPQMVRKEWLNLNGLWGFEPVTGAKELQPPLGRPLRERILLPFSIETTLSGVGRREAELWYRRTFALPRNWMDRRVLLHFGAVDWECRAWVNGKPVGEHKGGYDPFAFDITGALKSSGEQELVLYVFDPTEQGHQPRGKQLGISNTWFYTPTTGPWQTIWLEPVAPERIEELVMCPDVEQGRLGLTVITTPEAKGLSLLATVLDGGKVVAQRSIAIGQEDPPVTFTSQPKTPAEPDALLLAMAQGDSERTHTRLTLSIPAPRLWSPQSPHLYDLRLELRRDRKMLDTVGSYFGMRKIEVKSEGGAARILLNGQPIFLRGVLDQGYWPDGGMTAPTDAALRYDVEILKQMGFNTSRKHIKVEDPRWYYWCDKLGLIVLQDMPGGERFTPSEAGAEKGAPNNDLLFRLDKLPSAEKGEPEKQQFKLELYRMIRNLRNHPAIVCWTVFNEGYGVRGHEVPTIVNAVRRIDPARLVVDGSGGPFTGESDLIDLHYPSVHTCPDAARAVIFSEATGHEQIGMNSHRWDWSSLAPLPKAEFLDHVARLSLAIEQHENLRRLGWLQGYMFVQLSDVETELNGMLTFDRVPKIKPSDMARLIAPRTAKSDRVLLPTAEERPATWRYTVDKPAEGWASAGFDDSVWRLGQSAFGDMKAPPDRTGAYPCEPRFARTEWEGDEIWLRHSLTLSETNFAFIYAMYQQRGQCELLIDGQPIRTLWPLDNYYPMDLPGASDLLKKPGPHLVAIHAKRMPGRFKYLDFGLYGHSRSYDDFALDPTFRQPFKLLVPPSHATGGQVWKYTTATPVPGWKEAGFDDGSWTQAKGAFGELPPSGFGIEASYPARYINTTWTNRELWMRRSFRLEGRAPAAPMLLIHHQGPVEVYLNGEPIYHSDRSLPSYGLFPLEGKAAKALRPGQNSVAVYAQKSNEPGYVDVGIVDRLKSKR